MLLRWQLALTRSDFSPQKSSKPPASLALLDFRLNVACSLRNICVHFHLEMIFEGGLGKECPQTLSRAKLPQENLAVY